MQPGDLFDGAVGWINTSKPIRLRDLRGKIVLLDFWTYCCINCHHILADLEYLEKKYANQLVVIGVHSPKFLAERDTANIRKKVAEYKIKHPVANDADQVIWDRMGIQGWPTLVLLDANGQVVGGQSGEGTRELFDQAIGKLVAKHRAAKELDEVPLVFPAESEKPHDEGLLYPGKILADAKGDRLFISDTAHNRIVVTKLDGTLLETIGGGEAGFTDGSYEKASFHRQQGLRLVDETLYVADTENHSIRAVDLKAKRVKTIAGTGKQSHERKPRGPAKSTGMNSPWDLIQLPGTKSLIIAMAGPHQLWKLDLERGVVSAWAGDGRENIADGEGLEASFAQPSGLATDGTSIFVADSEGSSVRSVAIAAPHTVTTLLGQHDVRNVLFSFGDVDGVASKVRLQHCLGLDLYRGRLFIADTYNNKIKVCDPKTAEVETYLGSVTPGYTDDPPKFDQPGGLSVANGVVYVADTNNHAIRAIDLKTSKVRTLKIAGLTPPKPRTPPKFRDALAIEVPAVKVAPGAEFTLEVSAALPADYKLNNDAATVYLLETPKAAGALSDEASPAGVRVNPPKERFDVRVPLAKPASAGESLDVKLSASFFVCRIGNEGFCTIKNFVWTIPVQFADGGANRVRLSTEGAKASR